MKVNEQELKDIIREVIQEKLGSLKESSDYSAKRRIIHSAQQASMDFENEITSLLNLTPADDLAPNLQSKHFEIAEEMKAGIMKSVMGAVRRFASLPRITDKQP